ncbi:hypothetical protein G6F62_015223 [Rhizopus arrhizus]|nr:hypothetical protein G6F40_017141 [Rhizopus arrhizus]KAG1307442.1 hypothetical protein G6F62_015223 [Rhizopus arrhizus]
MQVEPLHGTAAHLQRGEMAIVDQCRQQVLDLRRLAVAGHRHRSSACACCHMPCSTSAAGCAGAIHADCPAHACIAASRFSCTACLRIGAVSPRCTGYGRGAGAPSAAAART